MNLRRIQISRNRESGQTMTEFALVLPILVLLLFAVIQFGIVFNNYMTITDAARAGARKGTAAFSPDPVGEAEDAARASAANLDQGELDISITASPALESGADMTVTASYPYQLSLLGVVVQSGTLSSSTTERME